MSAPRLIQLENFNEENGRLVPFEALDLLGWHAARTFCVYAEAGSVRGEHAHLNCRQAILAVDGAIEVFGESINGEFRFLLTSPDKVIEIPRLCWATERFNTDAIMLVLAEFQYDEADYLRDYPSFQKALARPS